MAGGSAGADEVGGHHGLPVARRQGVSRAEQRRRQERQQQRERREVTCFQEPGDLGPDPAGNGGRHGRGQTPCHG